MFKKIVSVFLCVVTVFTFTAAAFVRSGGITAEAAGSYTLPYYYYQMSDEAQDFYLYLRKAVKECRSKIKLNVDFDDEEFLKIVELLILHDALTFNLDNMEVLDETRKSVTIGFDYKYDKETYDKMVKKYDKAVNKILSKLTDKMSTYTKIKTIHDEIINNTVYDLDASNCDNIYGTLVDNKAKCTGYAKTFAYVCGKAGIRAVSVIGHALNADSDDDGHMWNKVYYNKKWYNVDVTWDDPETGMIDNLSYDYFMVEDSSFWITHEEDNLSFEVPEADDDTKNYFVMNKKYAETEQDAEKLIKNEFKNAVQNGKTSFSIKFASKKIMRHARDYINDDDNAQEIFKYVNQNSNKKVCLYLPQFNEDMLILEVVYFYENTKLEDYFLDPDSLSMNTLDTFEEYGIT
ncbi:MAG: hypothetical protein NC253_06090 [Ruminococcus sp.]|nr:hypothetical protein [Ruminococcus sp.]MCM1480029.1 hypothetical protein [Muribaculaceae bacterium]